MEMEANRELLCPKCLARDGRRVGFRNAELLKRHLCSVVHYNCLAYECPRCTQRCATHKELDHHLFESHGVQVGMEAYQPDRHPATEANRREVCDLVALAVGRQQGALPEARDDPTVITRVIGPPSVPAAVEGAGPTDTRREGPIVPPHIQQQTNEATGPRRRATARVNRGRQPVQGNNRGNETPTAPALEAPARAIPPPQMATPVQPRPVVTARGGYVMVNCQECNAQVEDNYEKMRGHALSHAGDAGRDATSKVLQACIAQWMGRCFPNSRVRNDMTCNSINCWTDVTPASKSVAQAGLWQRTHVEERHIEPADLNLRCPVDGCNNRNELFPALKKLNEHIAKHGWTDQATDRYKEMKRRVNAKTAEKTLICFPVKPPCKRRRRGELDEEAN